MEFLIEQRIDLAGVNPVYRYDQPMEYGDGGAHRWIVWASKRGEKADLKNLTAKCFIRRAASAEEKAQGMGSVTVIQEAQVDSESGSVSCLFDKACYAGVGAIAAVMRLYDAESHVVAAAKMTGVIERNTSDTVYDPSGLIPSLDELLAQISAIEAATKAANEAAAAAKAAADSSTHPPYIDAANNHWFVWNVSAGKYADTGVPATGPQGLPGDDAPIPYIGENGNWFVAGADTGTKAQGPAGANGAGSGTVTGIEINGQTYSPDESGVIVLPELGGGDSDAAAETAVSEHNADGSSHDDIRQLIVGLTNRLNALADSDDTTLDQLSEIVAYIKSNKSLIDSITTGKVSTSDIADNLTTNVNSKVLSAAQGVVLKGLIDTAVSELKNDKADKSGWTANKYIGTDASGNMIVKDVSSYTLPQASSSTLGGVKVGDGLSIDENGVLSLNIPSAAGVNF